MSPLPLTIHSDQEAATALLGEIAARCAAHGAEWHPELRAEVAEGAMRLWAPPGTTGPLITMPTPLLVPIEAARWGDGATALELLTPPETASPVQRQLLELHAALYNATDKLRWWSTQHPARLVERCPAVAEALLPLKPGHGEGPLKPTAAERFLATRSFGWRAEPVDDPKQTVLMPLIDLSTITTAALPSTPFAHCAPLQISVEGVGLIQVEHQVGRRPAHPFDAPRVALEEGGVRLSHLCLPPGASRAGENHPQAGAAGELAAAGPRPGGSAATGPAGTGGPRRGQHHPAASADRCRGNHRSPGRHHSGEGEPPPGGDHPSRDWLIAVIKGNRAASTPAQHRKIFPSSGSTSPSSFAIAMHSSGVSNGATALSGPCTATQGAARLPPAAVSSPEAIFHATTPPTAPTPTTTAPGTARGFPVAAALLRSQYPRRGGLHHCVSSARCSKNQI